MKLLTKTATKKTSLASKAKKIRVSYDYEKSYVEENLLAYLGNKRKLLTLIVAGIKEVETNGSVKVDRKGWFVDYFAGTGVVSRLAKSLGYRVIANDWEPYSYCTNRAFVAGSPALYALFEAEGGLEKTLKTLNEEARQWSESEEQGGKGYFATYYCPAADAHPDLKRERLFYTQENGRRLDYLRNAIEKRYGKREEEEKKNFLLALLLYGASKHSNTSGVFKGFHYGFGGRGKNALKRILGKVQLKKVSLSKKTQPCRATQEEALHLAKQLRGKPVEIAYLDPPYNQHQYGSNYHLLNTVALNDRPPVNKEFLINGRKVNKSAIRKDWINTRSKFCYKKTALQEFKTLVETIEAKYLLVSYSTEGIINFEALLQVLAKKGKLGILTTSYVRYPGGRQSLNTVSKNIEFLLLVDTASKSEVQDLIKVKKVLLLNAFRNSFLHFFPVFSKAPILAVSFSSKRVKIRLRLLTAEGEKNYHFQLCDRLLLPEEELEAIARLPFEEQKQLYKKLNELLVRPNDVKVKEIEKLLSSEMAAAVDRPHFERERKRLLKKVPKPQEAAA